MATLTKLPIPLQVVYELADTSSSSQMIRMAKTPIIRETVTNEVEKTLMTWRNDSRKDLSKLPGVEDDRMVIGLAFLETLNRALAENLLSDVSIHAILQILVKKIVYEKGDPSAVEKFEAQYGSRPPSFLVIKPSKTRPLHCTDFAGDPPESALPLKWNMTDHLIQEAKALWGAHFFVFYGGDSLAYQSLGKGVLDLIEKHPDCFFLVFTKASLIDEHITQRLSQAGNLMLAIAVDSGKECPDAHNGAGVFDKVLETMGLLRQNGVPFGISLTATRDNAEEILSDEFIDFFIQQGALSAWLFQYMPIGLAATLDRMVTPQQRAWMWRRAWEIVREKRFFLADFCNSSTACDGCLSAGGHGAGGHFYVDWNGAVSPCVFTPYSPVNINAIYAQGGTLNDVWQDPFFAALRQWQLEYKQQNRNGLAPCPNRDHHRELEEILELHVPEPTDIHAAETLVDPGYAQGLDAYNQEYEAITRQVWVDHYLSPGVFEDGTIAPLPLVPARVEDPAGSVPGYRKYKGS